MKLFVGLTAFLFAFSAHAILRTHFGKVSYSGGQYHCTYENDGDSKDMKWVYFELQRYTGEGLEESVQLKVDKVVAPGGSITASSGCLNAAQFNVPYCKFYERVHSSHSDGAPVPSAEEL